MWFHWAITALFILSFLVIWMNREQLSPTLGLLNRWLRWLLSAFVFAAVLQWVSGPESRPLWLLICTGALLYSLFETIWNWLAISAMSRSTFALFPSFRRNHEGDEWPSHKRFLLVRDWLRERGFTKLESLKAVFAEDSYLRSTIYQNAEGNTRLQVIFIPHRGGQVSCYVFSSIDAEGNRCITDNLFMPFGGFYPESWSIERYPLCRKLSELERRHQHNCRRLSGEPTDWDCSPLEDLNDQQRLLERLNLQAGFLNPRDQQEEFGRITSEGRYRIWKELWLLNYFGRSGKS